MILYIIKFKKDIFIFFIFLFFSINVFSQQEVILQFNTKPQTRQTAKGQIYQEIYLNDKFMYSAEVQSRISTVITDFKNDTNTIEADFKTSKRILENNIDINSGWELLSQEKSTYTRKSDGLIFIDNKYTLPVERNIPYFPNLPIKKGSTWTSQSYELHNLSVADIGKELVKIPFVVNYTYNGKKFINGKLYDVIDYHYQYKHPLNIASNINTKIIAMNGASKTTLLWDSETSLPYKTNREFQYSIVYDNYEVQTYLGEGELVYENIVPIENKDSLKQQIQQLLKDNNIDDITVDDNSEGIKLTLDKIKFKPDSHELLASENEKLKLISSIISKLKKDILIEGHTASFGSKESSLRLSLKRAQTVGDYFLKNKIIDSNKIYYKGWGDAKPVVPHSQKDSGELNRRVEITILEN